jgi:hypothetical protein
MQVNESINQKAYDKQIVCYLIDLLKLHVQQVIIWDTLIFQLKGCIMCETNKKGSMDQIFLSLECG